MRGPDDIEVIAPHWHGQGHDRFSGSTRLPLPNTIKRKRSSVRDSEGVSMRAGWEVCDDEFRRQLMRPC